MKDGDTILSLRSALSTRAYNCIVYSVLWETGHIRTVEQMNSVEKTMTVGELRSVLKQFKASGAKAGNFGVVTQSEVYSKLRIGGER